MKKEIIALLIGSISIGLLSSCNTYLSPAIAGNNIAYLPRPMVSDSTHSITNITGAYAGSSSPGRSVSFEMGMLSVSRGHAYKYFNFAYGAFGFLGTASYNLYGSPSSSTDVPSFQKTYGGFGFRSSIGFHDTSESGYTDFRFINWENAWSSESGNYTDFRKNVYDNHALFTSTNPSNKTNLWTTGISTEIIWKGQKHKNLRQAFKLFFGGTPGLESSFIKEASPSDAHGTNSISSSYFSMNYNLEYRKFSFGWDFSTNVNTATKLYFGYRL